MIRDFLKWCAVCVYALAITAVCILIIAELPEADLLTFVVVKAAAFGGVFLLYLLGHIMHRAGIVPKLIERLMQEEDEIEL